MHAYVHTLAEDPRNYVAIGPIPSEIGNKISQIISAVIPIHWLFAGDSQNSSLNGFLLTGN